MFENDYLVQQTRKDGLFNMIFPIKFERTTGVSKVFEHIKPSLTPEEILAKANGKELSISKEVHAGQLKKQASALRAKFEDLTTKLAECHDDAKIAEMSKEKNKVQEDILRLFECLKFIEAEGACSA